MELRQYLDILRRHRWFILEATVVVGLVAGVLSALQTPSYQGTARVLLRPNDPAEQINPENTPSVASSDPERYVTAQKDIIESEAVANEAAKSLPGVTPAAVQEKTSAAPSGASDVLEISGTDVDPVRARDLANAVAKGYIENRRLAAVAGLQRVADDIESKLGPLLTKIAELDVAVGALPTTPGAAAAIDAPTRPATTPSQTAPLVRGTDAGGQATTIESLKAARYAAAVQYEELYGRQQELEIEIGLKRGEAEIVAEAKTPTAPVSPKPKRDAALGALVGLLLGTGIVFLREQLDDRIRSASEVERLTGLPLLAQLPYDEDAAKATGVAVVDRPNSPLSEAMRSLRTSIQYLGVDLPVRSIVVTSAVPGEGKSLVAANLAAVYAQADYRTLLISADLRRSSINEVFGDLGSSIGLTGVLASSPVNVATANGNGSFAAAASDAGTNGHAHPLLKTPVPNLLMLPSGPPPPNPSELLGSKRMGAVLAEYSAVADVVIIDSPPLLPVTDAAVLAAKSDGVVLVTAMNETRRDASTRARAILDATGARLLGTVVNKSPKSGGGYYYAGRYGDDANGPPTAKKRRSRRADVTHEATA